MAAGTDMHWSAVASQIVMAARSAMPAAQAAPAKPAPAQEEARPLASRQVSRVPTSTVRGEAYAGYAGSFALGGDFLARYRVFEGGGLCQWMMLSLTTRNFGCGIAAGFALRSPTYSQTWGVGAELLGVLGARYWKGVGAELLDPDPGGSATVPFAGVRAGASFYLDPFIFSFWLGVDDDLGRKHVTYTYDSDGLLGGPSVRLHGQADVGAVTWLAAWRTGVEYDVP